MDLTLRIDDLTLYMSVVGNHWTSRLINLPTLVALTILVVLTCRAIVCRVRNSVVVCRRVRNGIDVIAVSLVVDVSAGVRN